jgi:hypothetical protein
MLKQNLKKIIYSDALMLKRGKDFMNKTPRFIFLFSIVLGAIPYQL